MRAVLQVALVSTADRACRGVACVELDLGFTPAAGIGFHHLAWGDQYRNPTRVTYDAANGSFDLRFAAEEFRTREECEARAEEYRRCGWVVR
jgi:hypothetical protein